MASTNKTLEPSPLEQLENLEGAVLRNLPPDGFLTIYDEPAARAMIVDALRGWRRTLALCVVVRREHEDFRVAGTIIAREAQDFFEEVKAALNRYLEGQELVAIAHEASQPPDQPPARALLAAAKRALTRKLRATGERERKDEILDGDLPWVD